MKKLLFLLLLIPNIAFAGIHDDIIKQDNIMYEYCQKQECSKEFEKFYINLQNEIKQLEKTNDWEMEEIEPYVFQMVPNPEILYYQYNDWVGIDIDHQYIYNKYHVYLNKEWNSYLSIYKDNKYMNWTYGMYLSKEDKQIVLNKCKTHLKQHPKFKMNYKVRNTIKDIGKFLDQ